MNAALSRSVISLQVECFNVSLGDVFLCAVRASDSKPCKACVIHPKYSPGDANCLICSYKSANLSRSEDKAF